MASPQNDWFLHQWFKSLAVRFPHAWLEKELGYSSGKASNVLTGKKPYDKKLINEISQAMKIRPHELLMHPDEAHRIRRMEATLAEAAKAVEVAPASDPIAARRLAK